MWSSHWAIEIAFMASGIHICEFDTEYKSESESKSVLLKLLSFLRRTVNSKPPETSETSETAGTSNTSEKVQMCMQFLGRPHVGT